MATTKYVAYGHPLRTGSKGETPSSKVRNDHKDGNVLTSGKAGAFTEGPLCSGERSGHGHTGKPVVAVKEHLHIRRGEHREVTPAHHKFTSTSLGTNVFFSKETKKRSLSGSDDEGDSHPHKKGRTQEGGSTPVHTPSQPAGTITTNTDPNVVNPFPVFTTQAPQTQVTPQPIRDPKEPPSEIVEIIGGNGEKTSVSREIYELIVRETLNKHSQVTKEGAEAQPIDVDEDMESKDNTPIQSTNNTPNAPSATNKTTQKTARYESSREDRLVDIQREIVEGSLTPKVYWAPIIEPSQPITRSRFINWIEKKFEGRNKTGYDFLFAATCTNDGRIQLVLDSSTQLSWIRNRTEVHGNYGDKDEFILLSRLPQTRAELFIWEHVTFMAPLTISPLKTDSSPNVIMTAITDYLQDFAGISHITRLPNHTAFSFRVWFPSVRKSIIGKMINVLGNKATVTPNTPPVGLTDKTAVVVYAKGQQLETKFIVNVIKKTKYDNPAYDAITQFIDPNSDGPEQRWLVTFPSEFSATEFMETVKETFDNECANKEYKISVGPCKGKPPANKKDHKAKYNAEVSKEGRGRGRGGRGGRGSGRGRA